MTMDHEGDTLYAGTDDGRLVRWQFDENGEVAHREVVRAFADGRAITALALVLGDVSLAVGRCQRRANDLVSSQCRRNAEAAADPPTGVACKAPSERSRPRAATSRC